MSRSDIPEDWMRRPLRPDFKSSAKMKNTMKKKVTQSIELTRESLEAILRKTGGFSSKATIEFITKEVACEGSMVDPRDPCYKTVIEGVKISEESEIDIGTTHRKSN